MRSSKGWWLRKSLCLWWHWQQECGRCPCATITDPADWRTNPRWRARVWVEQRLRECCTPRTAARYEFYVANSCASEYVFGLSKMKIISSPVWLFLNVFMHVIQACSPPELDVNCWHWDENSFTALSMQERRIAIHREITASSFLSRQRNTASKPARITYSRRSSNHCGPSRRSNHWEAKKSRAFFCQQKTFASGLNLVPSLLERL